MSLKLGRSAASEFKSHWRVVLAACGGVAVSTINVYSAGLFIEPLEREFGWTRAQISSGHAIPAFLTVILGPFMGAAIDRFGPRRIGIFGVFLLACFTAVLSLVGPSIWSWWLAWIPLAFVNLFIQPSVWTSAVSSFFAAGRGLALALTLSGSGIGSLVTPVLTFRLIERWGWRCAFVGLAVGWGIVVVPLVCLFFTSPKDMDRQRGHTLATNASDGAAVRVDQVLSLRFLTLAVAGFLVAAVVVTFVVSLVPILSSRSLSRGHAAQIASMLGVSAIAGRLTIGFLLDRLEGRYLAVVSVCLPVAASLLLIWCPGSAAAALAAVLILGLSLGAELDLVAYLTSRYFNLQSFGLLFGTIAGLITLAGGAGPWVINLMYDRTHTYVPALLTFIPMCLLSAILFLFLGPYPTTERNAISELQ